MADDTQDTMNEIPLPTHSGRGARKEVDLFPAIAEKRLVPMTSMRSTAPERIGTQISMFEPVSFDEAVEIVECLRSRAATTISLGNMKKIDANRLVDFVAGASAALDGDFHKLSEQVYIFCPSNIKITVPGKAAASAAAVPGFDTGAALDFLYSPSSSNPFSTSSSPWPNA
ncbi:MAG: cell division protein SepF [Candidatus Melainabacteria bacterium]|jgi:cell division inhibitor SepF|nr:cell division protein SepF [Candidatus Melainabacteria bacterium]